LSPDGRYGLSMDFRPTIRDLRAGTAVLGELHGNRYPMTLASTFLPDSTGALVTVKEKQLLLLDPATAKERARLVTTQVCNSIIRLAVLADGKRVLSGDVNGRVYLWEMAGGPQRPLGVARGSATAALAPSQDGRRAVLAFGNGALELWDLEKA